MTLTRRVVLAGVVVAVAVVIPRAVAHTAVADAEPGPGERVSHVVESASLEFLEPVVPTPELVVTRAGGAPVPGLAPPEMVGDDTVVVAFDALVRPGRYQVDYRFSAVDGHALTGAHQFVFAPDERAVRTGAAVVTFARSVLRWLQLVP